MLLTTARRRIITEQQHLLYKEASYGLQRASTEATDVARPLLHLGWYPLRELHTPGRACLAAQ